MTEPVQIGLKKTRSKPKLVTRPQQIVDTTPNSPEKIPDNRRVVRSTTSLSPAKTLTNFEFADSSPREIITSETQLAAKTHAPLKRFNSILDIIQEKNPNLKKASRGLQNLSSLNFIKGLVSYWRKDFKDLPGEDLVELVIFILKKDIKIRNTKDVNALMTCFSSLEIFLQYEPKFIEQCVKNMYHVFIPKGGTVFQIGSQGKNFWVILRGTVGVMVPAYQENEDTKKPKSPRDAQMFEVTTFTRGSYFGETALTDGSSRQQTMICKESSHFAVLDREAYLMVQAQKRAQRITEEAIFLSSLPLFKEWSIASLKKLLNFTKLLKFQRGQKVYKEGEKAQKMYIIRKGEFKVLKDIIISQNKDPSMSSPLDAMKRGTTKKKTTEITIQGEKEILGAEELLSGTDREYTVSCNSVEAEAYEIDKRDLVGKVLKSTHAQNWLKNYAQRKYDFYQNRAKTLSSASAKPTPVEIKKTEEEEDYSIPISTRANNIRGTAEILEKLTGRIHTPQPEKVELLTRHQGFETERPRNSPHNPRSISPSYIPGNKTKHHLQSPKMEFDDYKITPRSERKEISTAEKDLGESPGLLIASTPARPSLISRTPIKIPIEGMNIRTVDIKPKDLDNLEIDNISMRFVKVSSIPATARQRSPNDSFDNVLRSSQILDNENQPKSRPQSRFKTRKEFREVKCISQELKIEIPFSLRPNSVKSSCSQVFSEKNSPAKLGSFFKRSPPVTARLHSPQNEAVPIDMRQSIPGDLSFLKNGTLRLKKLFNARADRGNSPIKEVKNIHMIKKRQQDSLRKKFSFDKYCFTSRSTRAIDVADFEQKTPTLSYLVYPTSPRNEQQQQEHGHSLKNMEPKIGAKTHRRIHSAKPDMKKRLQIDSQTHIKEGSFETRARTPSASKKLRPRVAIEV